MSMTRYEAELIYTRALARARVQWALAQQAGQVLDANVIARDMRDRVTVPASVTYRDLQTAARRAIRAVEFAHSLRANPGSTGLANDVPYNYAIRSQESRYQYRVVVNTVTNGRLDTGGQMFKFGAGARLTHQEAVDRAIKMALALNPNADYMPGRTANTTAAQLGGVVVAVFQHEPAR